MAKDKFSIRLKNAYNEIRGISVDSTNSVGLPYGFSSSPLSLQKSLQLSAVYRCVDVVSNAIASQFWELLKHNPETGWTNDPFDDIAYMLNFDPNPAMSRFTQNKTVISKVLLEGNGYQIIRRDERGDPYRLDLVNGLVTMYKRGDGSIYYMIQYAGYDVVSAQLIGSMEIVEAENMIHIKNYSYDGLIGVSTLKHAANSLGISQSAEASAKGFYASGANMSGIVTSTGRMTPEKAALIKKSWGEAFSISEGTPGGIAVVESGLTFHPVSINPKDAQMLESRKFNIVEICRFFGVHPSKAFDDSNLTYSNIESFQLGFISDTITPLNSNIEAEYNKKLLRPSQRRKTKLNLDLSELLAANLDTTANYYTKMLGVGAYTPNEIRAKVKQPLTKDGDKSYVPMNYIALTTPVTQNTKLDKNIKIAENE